jgi:hypothetical protein
MVTGSQLRPDGPANDAHVGQTVSLSLSPDDL